MFFCREKEAFKRHINLAQVDICPQNYGVDAILDEDKRFGKVSCVSLGAVVMW